MKITFTMPELTYLNEKTKIIGRFVRRPDIESGLAQTIRKLRNKFSPSALVSFVNGKEKKLLLDMLTYRQGDLVKQNSISEETNLIQGLIVKLGG